MMIFEQERPVRAGQGTSAVCQPAPSGGHWCLSRSVTPRAAAVRPSPCRAEAAVRPGAGGSTTGRASPSCRVRCR